MKYEILISTMNNIDYDLHTRMNLFTDSVVVNQFPNGIPKGEPSIKVITDGDSVYKYYNVESKGLSKSRNLALKYSQADICILADDDMIFKNNAFESIKNIYNSTDSEINVYKVARLGETRSKRFGTTIKRLNKLGVFKVSSVEISFQRKAIINNSISFDELLGAGSLFQMGEENKFLLNCIRKRLTVTYFPYEIAQVSMEESSWFSGYDKDYFRGRGASYYAISKILFPFLILQFLIRKQKELRINSVTDFLNSLKWSLIGAYDYSKKLKG